MHPEVQKAFDHLSFTVNNAEFDLCDVFDAIAELTEQSPPLAYSLTRHLSSATQEQAQENQGCVEIPQVFLEAIRRAFCDRETAKQYGTEYIAADHEAAAGFLLLCSSSLDAHMRGASLVPEATGHAGGH